MRRRIEHIDVAKGVSIALVALNHSQVKVFFPEVMQAMSLFRMPLFFFLSGVFFSYLASPRVFFLKKSEALLKPYFFVLTVVFILSTLFSDEKTFWQLRGMFYGTGETLAWVAMWFLTHLFAVYCFSYFIFKFTFFPRLPALLKWGGLLAILVVGSINIKYLWEVNVTIFDHSIILPGLPFSIDIILVTSVFFISGHFLKEKVINFSPNIILLFVSTSALLYIIIYTDAYINFNDREYNHPILATVAAISGIYVIMSFAYVFTMIRYCSSVFITLGGASLYILIFHEFVGKEVYGLLQLYHPDFFAPLLIAVIAFIFSVFIPLLIKWIIENNSVLALFFLPLKTNKLLQKKST